LDIACGHGHYGITIAKKNPHVHIFALDWPAVLEEAVRNAHDAGVSDRYHTIPGDVFSANFGEGYDLALITNFLPDFGPKKCEQLLARIRPILSSVGRAAVLQWIPDDDRLSPPSAPSLALSLLAQTPEGDVYRIASLRTCFGAPDLCGPKFANSGRHFSAL
jgi:cyclopropane fatty-acyl-phospholipid synthase-like methyltransferase